MIILLVLVAWYFISSMLYNDVQSIGSVDFSKSYRRADAGMSIMFGFVFAVLWPLGLPAAYLVTGFAEHGFFWRNRT